MEAILACSLNSEPVVQRRNGECSRRRRGSFERFAYDVFDEFFEPSFSLGVRQPSFQLHAELGTRRPLREQVESAFTESFEFPALALLSFDTPIIVISAYL